MNNYIFMIVAKRINIAVCNTINLIIEESMELAVIPIDVYRFLRTNKITATYTQQ